MEKEEQDWEKFTDIEEQEQEQREEESDLVVRKSRNGNDSKISDFFAAAAVDDDDDGGGEVSNNGVSDSNGHEDNGAKIEDLLIIAENDEQKKMEELDGVLENEPEEEEEEEEEEEAINKEQKKENLVFFDKAEDLQFAGARGDFFAAAGDEEDGDEVSNNGVSNSSGHEDNGTKTEDLLINAENEQKKMEELDGVLENEPEKEEEAINKEQKKENLVFFDKAGGAESTNFGENQNVKNPEPKKPDISSLDFVLQENHTTTINDKYKGNLVNNTFSSSNHQPSQVTFSNEIESAEVDLLNDNEDDDLEVTDLDVERVIKQQNTHDLYCPNCNSCITRRVILRKRKRKVRVTDEEAKRNKTESAVKPVLGTGSVQSQEANVDDNDAQIPNVDENEHERGTDVFRCLSCFSFFIPTGNGLFKVFREKKVKDKTEDERAPPIVKKNWFTSMFASNNKPETNLEQGSIFQTDVRKSDVRVVTSSNVGEQSGQTSFSQNAPSPARDSEGLVGTAGNGDALESGDNILHFPKPSLNGNLTSGTGYKFDTTRTETVDTTEKHFDSYTEDESPKDVHVIRENNSSVTTHSTRTRVFNGESNEDTVSFSQQDGLKSTNNGSLTLGNSKEGQIINQMMQSGGEADNDAIQLLTPVSDLKASNVDGKSNISVSVPHEDQDAGTTFLTESVDTKNTNFSSSTESGHVHSTETSKHTVTTTRYEVHSGEPLQVNNISVLKGVPFSQGKDTYINIDSQPNGLSQAVQEITGPTETSSLLQSSTQTNIAGREITDDRKEYKVEVIKSIVYGGLAESITSLSVVSSAAGGGAATLNILALGMASLIGGLFIICHNIWELKCDRIEQVNNQIVDEITDQSDRYKQLLGRRQNFALHAIVVIISYLVFGLVAPVVYGFSFRKTDDKQLKLVLVSASSLLCIGLLAIGRAYVRRPPKPYLKSVFTFVILGFMVSGVSYAAGELVERILEKLGLFQTSSVSDSVLNEMMMITRKGSGWASY